MMFTVTDHPSRRRPPLVTRAFDLEGARQLLSTVRGLQEELSRNIELESAHHRLVSAPSVLADRRIRLSDPNIRRDELMEALRQMEIDWLGGGSIGFPTLINGALAYFVVPAEETDVRWWRYRDQCRLHPVPTSWYTATVPSRSTSPGSGRIDPSSNV